MINPYPLTIVIRFVLHLIYILNSNKIIAMPKKPVNIRLDREMIEEVEKRAKAAGVSFSDFVRNAIAKEIGREDIVEELKSLIREQNKWHRRMAQGIDSIIELLKKIYPEAKN